MDAEHALNSPRSGVDGLVLAAHWAAAALLTLLGMTALLVTLRRLAGALAQPLPSVTLLVVGAVAAAVALGVRWGWRFQTADRTLPPSHWAVMLSATLAVVLLGAALCKPGTSLAGWLAFWLPAALGEIAAWLAVVRQTSGRRTWNWPRRWRRDAAQRPACHAVHSPHAENRAAVALDVEALPPENVLQQLVRSAAADGSDVLAGFVRIAFVAGQRTGSVHVAFCPPFARTPNLAVEQLDGPDARIKTAQLLPYGARLDLKLAAEADQPLDVLLQFEARDAAENSELGT